MLQPSLDYLGAGDGGLGGGEAASGDRPVVGQSTIGQDVVFVFDRHSKVARRSVRQRGKTLLSAR